MYRLIFATVLLLFVLNVVAQTTISCNDPSYANKELVFYQNTDPVTANKEQVFRLKFDQQGKAISEIPIKNIQYVFSDFGVYRGRLFLEPGKSIELKMPPLRDKSFAEEKNPYFSPITFWIATVEPTSLNMEITAFTQEVNRFTDKYFQELYFKQSRSIFDSLVLLTTPSKLTKNKRLIQHIDLSLKKIELEALRLKTEDVSQLMISLSPDIWLDPAFNDLFNYAYTNQLAFLANAKEGKAIGAAIASGDINSLRQLVSGSLSLKGDIVDLALLKMLYDEYFSGRYSKTSIEKLIDTSHFRSHRNKHIRRTSEKILGQLSLLRKGSTATPICLKKLDGTKACSDDNTDKFKYLLFADTEMIVCREHLKYLTTLNSKFRKHLEIIIVLKESQTKEIESFISSNKIPGTVFIDHEEKYIKEYQIRSYPTCFLLDDNHKVVFQNAKAPLEGFEQQFAPFLQQFLFQQMRNQHR